MAGRIGEPMLTVALSALRTRLPGHLGSCAAVALAVAIIGACGLLFTATVSGPPGGDRYAAASVVVSERQTLGEDPVAFLIGADRVAERRYLPASSAARLAGVPGVRRVVADVSFSAQVVGASESTGRSWEAATLTPYTLVAGRPPGPGEVVVDRSLAGGLRVGSQVSVLTSGGVQRLRLAGLAMAPSGARLTPAVFFPEREAVRLAGDRVSAVGLFAAPGVSPKDLAARVGKVLPSSDVLYGDDRRAADPSPVTSQFALLRVVLFAIGGNAAFVAVFVIAATFAFSVLQRHRDIALLRAIGATPRQVRTMIALEATVVSVVGALAGVPLAVWLSGVMAGVLRDREVVPAEFRAGTSPLPLVIAVLAGLAVTQLAVFAAARRAARTRAVEAMRSASVDRRPVPRGRMITGLVALGLAVPLAVGSASAGGETAAGAAFGLAMISLVGAALLAPLAVRPLARLAGAPVARLTRATGLLAQANTAAGARRTAGAAVPLMLAVTLGATLLSTQATKRDATLSATAARIQAESVLVPESGPGLPPSLAAGLPGVTAASPTLPTTVYAGPPAERDPVPALGVDAATIGQVMAVRADLSGLRGQTVAVSDTFAAEYGIGGTLDLTLGDGTASRLRVAAVYPSGLGLADVLLPADLVTAHSTARLADAVYLRLAPGARQPAAPPGARVLSAAEYVQRLDAAPDISAVANYLLVAVMLAYIAISIVNTLVTATLERAPEFRLLRLLGATRRQVLRMVIWETVIVATLGGLIALVISGVALAGVARGLGRTLPAVPLAPSLGLLVGCALLALLATTVPANAILRRPIH
ncbi:FtsX-like permease family protein [Actinomadura sp. 6N118]|uniref:FtsX-like permease family protein n=1 Tax=Actinomadura sp. 6N118 TaxID=3375151 RepID=UPI0037879B1A